MCLINDGIEDNEHFLLHCHAFDDQRCDLLGAVNKILHLNSISNLSNQTFVHIMFYGDKRFSHDENKKNLESTLKFIHTSERFL